MAVDLYDTWNLGPDYPNDWVPITVSDDPQPQIFYGVYNDSGIDGVVAFKTQKSGDEVRTLTLPSRTGFRAARITHVMSTGTDAAIASSLVGLT